MGYQTDYGVIDYLKRRVKYYKRKRGMISRMIDNQFFIKMRGGEKNARRDIKAGIKICEVRIEEYSKAISELQKIL
jgi:hypothetical protein